MNVSLEKYLKSQRMPHARNTERLKPDWSTTPHKGMTEMSKQEILSELRELVKKETAATDEQDKKLLEQRKQELFAMYESFASPDRKTLLDEALAAMKSNTAGFLKKSAMPTERMDVFDFIKESDQRRAGMAVDEVTLSNIGSRQTEETFQLSAGGSIKAKTGLGRGISMEIFQDKLQVLSVGQDGKVKHHQTAEEKKLRAEITDFYTALRRNADTPPPAGALDTRA
ncbi:MAG: hypothetical protein FWE60_02980 [Oscillospiraceae bacterium]|nr:hypothetical protein [Oscillospiraceae bacterium]